MRPTAYAAVATLVVVLAAVGAVADERWTPDGDACNQLSSTLDIDRCLGERTRIWDGRLNQVYRTLLDSLKDPTLKAQGEQLKAAQRAWIKYRDANCAYYEAGQGSISRIEAAYCMRDMTQSRAIELQQTGWH